MTEMPGTPAETRAALEHALGRIRAGWCKGHLTDDDGRVCLTAAIGLGIGCTDAAIYSTARWSPPGRVVMGVIAEQYPERLVGYIGAHDHVWTKGSLPGFNDHRDTTKDDVIAVLEKAIAGLD